MRWLLLALVGCGGGDGGSFEATLHTDGVESTFSHDCILAGSSEFWDALAADGTTNGFEFKWKQDRITAAGTYTSTGVVSDIVLFTMRDGVIDDASGTVTFDTYDPPGVVAGSFVLSVDTTFDAAGTFDCR